MSSANVCTSCGAIIPEGRQVCPMCEKKSPDVINHPAHYANGNIEPIDFIEDKGLNFNLGNVIKYVARAGRKKSQGKSIEDKALEDLKKARFYIDREIVQREADLNRRNCGGLEDKFMKGSYQ